MLLNGIEQSMTWDDKKEIVHGVFRRYHAVQGIRQTVLQYLHAMEWQTQDLLRRILRIPDSETELFGIDQTKVLPFDKRFRLLFEICYENDPERLADLDMKIRLLIRLRTQLIASADTITLGECLSALRVEKSDFLMHRNPLTPEKKVAEGQKSEEEQLIAALGNLCDNVMDAVVEMTSTVTRRFFIEVAERRLNEITEFYDRSIELGARALQLELAAVQNRNGKALSPEDIPRIPSIFVLRVKWHVHQFVMNRKLSTDELYGVVQSQSLVVDKGNKRARKRR
jgi:hypothetical protein